MRFCAICGEADQPPMRHDIAAGEFFPEACRQKGCDSEAEVTCVLVGGEFVLRCTEGHVTRVITRSGRPPRG